MANGNTRQSQTVVVRHRLSQSEGLLPVRLAQVVENACKFTKGVQRIAQIKAESKGLLARGATVGEMVQGHQGLLKGHGGVPQGAALRRLGAVLLAVADRLVPHLTLEGMV